MAIFVVMKRSGTFSKMYTHIVFAVKRRESLINPLWEEDMFKYITGIVQNKGQKMLGINGVSNHIHFFIGFKPSCRVSDLVMEVKKSSNNWINDNHFNRHNFSWQEGFGSFTYAESQIDTVCKYIANQKLHHGEVTFREEYLKLLDEFKVEYKEEHLFDWI
jgi:putative transposase